MKDLVRSYDEGHCRAGVVQHSTAFSFETTPLGAWRSPEVVVFLFLYTRREKNAGINKYCTKGVLV